MSGELCTRQNLFVRKFDGIGVIHSIPLTCDRRIRAQSVEGAQEMLRLFFDDGMNGNFFVPESRFRSLLARGDMFSGSVSGSRLAGGCFVIRGPSGVHVIRTRDGAKQECHGHDGLVFEMSRAAVVEAMARLEDLHEECAKLFGAKDGLAPWEPFPRSADMRFIETGMRACGALSSIAPGDEAAMSEEERTAFIDSCPKDRSDPSDELTDQTHQTDGTDQTDKPEQPSDSATEDKDSTVSSETAEEERSRRTRKERQRLIRAGTITPADDSEFADPDTSD